MGKKNLTSENLHMSMKRNPNKKNWIFSNNSPPKKEILKTNYIKVKIDNTQQKKKRKLCGDRDETITKGSSLAQKEYKTSKYLLGKVIDWKPCVTIPTRSPEYINFFETLQSWPVNPLPPLGSFFQLLWLAFPYPLPVTSKIAGSGLCLVSHQKRQRDRLLNGPPT